MENLEKIKNSKEFEENGQDIPEEVIKRAKEISELKENLAEPGVRNSISQAKSMAEKIDLNLENRDYEHDPISLYATLRTRSSAEDNPRAKMSDQELFAEVLRMSGDTESLEKFKKEYPNIFDES